VADCHDLLVERARQRAIPTAKRTGLNISVRVIITCSAIGICICESRSSSGVFVVAIVAGR
jgi:hypothetical protein